MRTLLKTYKILQNTIYVDSNGEEQTTSKIDLSDIKTTEIVQIGFYENKIGEIQVVKMPRLIEKVPDKLPSEITSLQEMFSGTSKFNQDISNWDTSKVTNMTSMFSLTQSFNQNISKWNVSNVTTMHNMFGGASKFNQDLSNWNTSNITNISYMFYYAKYFNGNISKWNTSKVTDMSYMFCNALEFDKDWMGYTLLDTNYIDKWTN
ncbi:BspA family leucine-rich repeat surface protein [Spiroplasma endosymbiont of Phycita roborella]|uniref:BspA family leucine-rich repeat surface protein n=1 Tax=Spiroplasma endosymbiont of Phycita roborella TaxID=3066311 RepID=UPI00313D7980